MAQWICMDGEMVPKDEAKVSVYDHAFLYGDGVFEGIRAYSGNVFKLKEHLDRLYHSAQVLMLEIPYTKEEMAEMICATLRKNNLEDAYIRVVVSRGKGNLGLDPFTCARPTVIVITEALALYPHEFYEKGLEIVTASTRRNRPDVLSPKVKSLNYLNNILVKIEAHLAGVKEAMMLNTEGYVVECSGDNIFLVKNGILYTPPTYLGALEGITRNAIIDLARKKGYDVIEEPFTQYDVYTADEVFLTGTAAEVIAVVKVDGRVIGDGQPGPHTKKLLEAFRQLVVQDGVKIYPQEESQVG